MSRPDTAANGEWGEWSAAWVAGEPPGPDPTGFAAGAGHPGAGRRSTDDDAVADLLRRLHRQRRRMLAAAAAEVLLTLLLVAATVAILHDGVAAWKVVWLITLWVFTCVAGAFAWWNRRAAWRVAGSAVEDVVQLARLRAERQLRTADFVLLLYAVEAVAVVAQLAWFDRLVPTAVLLLAAGGLAVAAWYVFIRRRLRGELARIDAFVRDALGS